MFVSLAFAQIRMKITPWNAIVEIDGKEYFPEEGVLNVYLPDGVHYVSAVMQGYETYYDTLLFGNGSKEYTINLKATSGYISVSGSGEYDGALVYVDNKLVGTMPMQPVEMVCGSHSVVVVKKGFDSYVERVVVTDGKTTDVVPLMSSKLCHVRMIASDDVEIWFDGLMQGVGEWYGALNEGPHTIITKKEAHSNGISQITLSASDTIQEIRLPLPQPIYGSLMVNVMPKGSVVLLDDKTIGFTPLFEQLLAIGKHKIEVKSNGYVSKIDSIEIKDNIKSEIQGELSPGGNVRLVCGVQDAVWHVDSMFVGSGSEISVFLPYGMHNIEIETEDYERYEGVFSYAPNMREIPFKLSPERSEYINFDLQGRSIRFVKIKRSGDVDKDFYISEFEVTQGLWEEVMGTNVFQQRNSAEKTGIFGNGDDFPMYYVSWNECMLFLRKLSKLLGVSVVLPTETQWEYVAAGGRYSRMEEEKHQSFWCLENADNTAHVIDSSGMNVLGVYGMFGNVSEMCMDIFDKSRYTLRICKGGSWCSPQQECNVKSRIIIDIDEKYKDVGLRLVINQ